MIGVDVMMVATGQMLNAKRALSLKIVGRCVEMAACQVPCGLTCDGFVAPETGC